MDHAQSHLWGARDNQGSVRVLEVAGAEPRAGEIMSDEGAVMVRHSEETVRWGEVGAAGQDWQSGACTPDGSAPGRGPTRTLRVEGQLHPGAWPGCHVDCGVQAQQEGAAVRSHSDSITLPTITDMTARCPAGQTRWSEEGRTRLALDSGS